jgi:uncharacterized protein (TIGR02246 family)
MKTVHVAILAIAALVALAPSNSRADQAADEAAIRKQDQAYVTAYNNHDAKALAALWSPEAVYMDPLTGESAVGREEIEKMFLTSLADLKDARLDLSVESIEFMSPNVAIETGAARMIGPNAEPEETQYSAVFVKRDGQWLLDRVAEHAPREPSPSNYERLKDLEWMIGSWIDQSDDATIQTDCQWTKNKNFMHRSFAVVVGDQVEMAGMQIVGWDPIAKQIRSWVFDSDGGFAEGTWKRQGDKWLIQQTGATANGSTTSATNIIKKVDDDSFTWQSVNRQVDGDVLPNLDEVLVVRKPSAATTPTNAAISRSANQLSASKVSP